MKITLLQTNPQWRDGGHNIDEAARLLDGAGSTDVVLLPEMWATGFDTQPCDDTLRASRRALEWMLLTARERGVAIGGTLAVTDDADHTWRNRFYFVTPEGIAAHYDKCHLFTPAREDLLYRAGDGSKVVAWRGVRFKLQTCFDLRFPESGRNAAADAYDVLVYAASWPASRRTAWDVLLRARAVENQAYCAGVNRTGCDPVCTYNGGSALVGPDGTLMGRLEGDACARTFTIDTAETARLRAKFCTLG